MALFYNVFFPSMWLTWGIYWWSPIRQYKVTLRRESTYSRLSYIVPTLIAVVLLFSPSLPIPPLNERFLSLDGWRIWGAIGLALNLFGLMFAVWARVHLGKNWSDTVTLKQDHELITSGPYRLVRHPIYTGLLLAFIGLAIARGEWRSLLGVIMMLLAFWIKLQLEERWMLEQFGSQYQTYRQRVAGLIPFVI